MHISNTSICGKINCPNTRLTTKLEAWHMEAKSSGFLWSCPRFSGLCGLLLNDATSNYGTMLMKLTWPRNWRIQIIEKPLQCDYSQPNMDATEWVGVRSVARTPCQRRKHVKYRFHWAGKKRETSMEEFITSTTTRKELHGSTRAIGKWTYCGYSTVASVGRAESSIIIYPKLKRSFALYCS